MIPRLTKSELVERLKARDACQDSPVKMAIALAAGRLLAYPDAIGILLFENLSMDSSMAWNAYTLVAFGPSNTIKTVEECEGKPLGDLPSRFQYATGWIEREELLRE